MKLSIMIITYNRSKEVYRAVQSCIPFMNEEMEVVIVDNCSPDNTKEILVPYLKSTKVNHIYHHSELNLGVAGGRNLAFSLCKGDYVFSLDDDAVIVTEDFFNKMIQFMDDHPKVVAAEVNILEPETKTSLNSRFRYRSKELDYDFIRSFCGCAHVLRRSFYEGQPLYPKKLFFGSEELYPSLKAWGEDQHVASIDDLTIHHLPSVINRYVGKDRIFYFLLNTYLIRRLMFPVYLRPILDTILGYRLMKYKMIDSEWRKKTRVTFKERYDKAEIYRIPLRVTMTLVKRFGFLAIF